ncbi:hypothetical protein GC093_08855 [Paenibacillus sp. LMG 31456]|uniref:Uncharacterized protein n=1 Tax=Paenibacillus foliorum TaxID=2654974 RepID=A0A972K003_9BACL|nr:hypothetical protein [Paenibacillus foliorum]NOU93325.1 hypothetical protein [Paenibacillus foliorum]
MDRWKKWLLCIFAAGLIITGWNTWKLQSTLHFDYIPHPIPTKPNTVLPDIPNDGSSYSFRLGLEKRLKPQDSADRVTAPK